MRLYLRSRIGYLIPTIILANFLSETAHGILTHILGTEAYAPMSVGEVVKGTVFLGTVLYALLHVAHARNRLALAALLGITALVCLQTLALHYTASEVIGTLAEGMRWLYTFFLMIFISGHMRRHTFSAHALITFLKYTTLIFYAIPIILAYFGVVGYARGDRTGYLGFVMNQNVVAVALVVMLPYFIRCQRTSDYVMLLPYSAASLLLASKLVYLSLALIVTLLMAIMLWRLIAMTLTTRRVRLPKAALRGLAVSALTAAATPFTPLPQKLAEIAQFFQSAVDRHISSGMNVVDALLLFLSTGRIRGIYRFVEWASMPEHSVPLLIGGGVRNSPLLATEVDWVDLATHFGVVSMLVLYGALILLLIYLLSFRQHAYAGETIISLSLSIAASLTAGHTYHSPAAGTIIGSLLGAILAQRRYYVIDKHASIGPSIQSDRVRTHNADITKSGQV